MFHTVPRDCVYNRTDDNPPQMDISIPTSVDISRFIANDLDASQISVGIRPPIASEPSSASEISYNIQDASPPQRQNLGSMLPIPANFDSPTPGFSLDSSAFDHTFEATFSEDNWQQNLLAPPRAAALPGDSREPQLPSQKCVLDMVNCFFSAQHQLLPSVHRESFLARLSDNMFELSTGPFLWVILALHCSCNKSQSSQEQYRVWMHTAHAKLELMSTTSVRDNTTNMLQASIWMIFDAYCRGDATNAWLLLGRTAQVTSALGLDRIDSKHRTARLDTELKSRSDIEIEERRKCMWCLALLDRVIVSVNGLALSVDDRYFHVDFPLPDEEFQEARDSVSKGP